MTVAPFGKVLVGEERGESPRLCPQKRKQPGEWGGAPPPWSLYSCCTFSPPLGAEVLRAPGMGTRLLPALLLTNGAGAWVASWGPGCAILGLPLMRDPGDPSPGECASAPLARRVWDTGSGVL